MEKTSSPPLICEPSIKSQLLRRTSRKQPSQCLSEFRLFEFEFMTFGLRDAAQTFQRFIDEVLQELEFCYAYIDDILIASISEEEHLKHLRILFKRLRKYDFIINLAKCVFE